MAIQISEKNLSPKAQKALNNAVNKSQFLRDAIEFYVSREYPEAAPDPEIKNDIKEIKELLLRITTQPGTIETAVSIEKVTIPEAVKPAIKAEAAEKPKAVINNDAAVSTKETVTNQPDSDMSEAEKKAIEKMLDESLLNF